MEPFMGNRQEEEKSSYREGLRRDSTLLEDLVEPCKAQIEIVDIHQWPSQTKKKTSEKTHSQQLKWLIFGFPSRPTYSIKRIYTVTPAAVHAALCWSLLLLMWAIWIVCDVIFNLQQRRWAWTI